MWIQGWALSVESYCKSYAHTITFPHRVHVDGLLSMDVEIGKVDVRKNLWDITRMLCSCDIYYTFIEIGAYRYSSKQWTPFKLGLCSKCRFYIGEK